jgi:hypothetical protein
LSSIFSFNSQNQNFTTLAAYLAIGSGIIGIVSEGIKELLLEPQRKTLEEDLNSNNFRNYLKEIMHPLQEIRAETSTNHYRRSSLKAIHSKVLLININ